MINYLLICPNDAPTLNLGMVASDARDDESNVTKVVPLVGLAKPETRNVNIPIMSFDRPAGLDNMKKEGLRRQGS